MYPQALQIFLAFSFCLNLVTSTILLSQFQQISNFPQSCTDVYNAPITGCDASDFPKSCSNSCFLALESAQAAIDNACAGQQASLDSIIGQMFEGQGAVFMCTQEITPGSSASSSSSGSYSNSASSFSSTTLSSASMTSPATKFTTSSSSSKSMSTISTTSTIRRTSTVSALTSTHPAGSSTSASSSLSSSSSSSKPPGSKVFVTTAFDNGVATVLTSQAQRTSAANSNPDAFGGGGSPFEVGTNDATRVIAGCSMLIALMALGVLCVR